ncbi:unnamed protein product [Rhizophagus irregularis]|uniref:MIR domain-containing protein n=1 Tax=Rhizophagus irregularis TaxID=588596 RepID=A0A916EAW7_9GLOM|nr:unnamed protein product [Rhizophagus irregularis]
MMSSCKIFSVIIIKPRHEMGTTENSEDTSIPPGSSNSSSTTDEYIRFGSCIALQHSTTSRHLSSRSPDNKESSKGNKDQVFATRRKSENELWMVLQAYGERRRLKKGDAVPYNAQIRLGHIVSRRNLRSHPDYISPISNQQEVICHDENTSDLNDNWHIQTGATLHSHSIMLDNDDNQEVTCYGPGHEENDKWKAEHNDINDFIRSS